MRVKLRITAIGLAVLALGAVLLVKRVPQPPAFCDHCVMQRDVIEWRLVGRWNVFEMSTVSETPVSELLREQQACPAHEHQWAAPRRVADSELETPDAPRVRSLGFLNAPHAVSFLRSLFAYADQSNVACWREVAWQTDYASALESALRFSRFPENGFATRAEFLAWWDRNSYPLFNRLHEMIVAD